MLKLHNFCPKSRPLEEPCWDRKDSQHKYVEIYSRRR